MTLTELRKYKDQILKLSAEHGVGNVRVFGSVARGDADEKSDVDLLVSIEKLMGWKFFSLEPALEELLGCEVDVITDDSINRHIRQRVLAEATLL